jgi:hypothetical protein
MSQSQFNEFSSPSPRGEGELDEERHQPDVIELSSGAPGRPASASALANPGWNSGADTQRSRTLLASGTLLSDSDGLRRQWESVQVGFVDDPRRAVDEADSLVSSVIDELVSGFRQQHYRMEAQWSEGGEVSTDELREAFHRYRDFFERLLKV